jgi:hypothetical protein
MMTYYARPLTTKELVRRYLCGNNPVGAWIETSRRDLAAAVGRSAGQMTYHLRDLEADGWIAVASDAHGTLIEVLRSDLDSDSAHDRPAERSCQSDAPNGDHVTARHSDDLAHDRSGVVRNHEIHDSAAAAATHARVSITPPEPAHPLVAVLQEHGASQPIVRDILAAWPDMTPAQFLDRLAAARRRRDVQNAVAFVFGLLRRGEDVTPDPEPEPTAAPQEVHDGAPTRPDARRGAPRAGHAETYQRRRSAARPEDAIDESWRAQVPEFFGWPKHLIPERYREAAGVS